jgi:signal transduction histidine kinase
MAESKNHIGGGGEDGGEVAALKEALRLSEERFKLISLATNDALWDWDLKSGKVWWGENFFTTFHYASADIEPGIDSWKNRIHPEDLSRISASIQQCICSGGSNWSERYRFLRKDGLYRDVFDRGFVQHSLSGEAVRMVGAMMDVSETKKAEVEVQRLYREMEERVRLRTHQIEEANEALEAFTYSVSHDLRAPLRHVTGFLQLLARSNASRLDDEGKRFLNIVLSAAERMAQLIDALLSFSRVGKSELHITPVSLSGMVAEVVQNMSVEAEGREVAWALLPMGSIEADPILIRQVLVNLIDNALKYTRSRPLARIEISATESPSETVVSVKDNGVGFDMKYADKLFSVFQRLHTECEFEGHGVGLANVKRIVVRHGGRVWAEAEEGRGASFFFSIPKPAPQAAAHQNPPSP